MTYRPTIILLLIAVVGVVAAVLTWRSERSGGAAAGDTGPLVTAEQLPLEG